MSFENKRACIAIDVSKGHSHFQGFYSAGVPASEATSFDHTKSGVFVNLKVVHYSRIIN